METRFQSPTHLGSQFDCRSWFQPQQSTLISPVWCLVPTGWRCVSNNKLVLESVRFRQRNLWHGWSLVRTRKGREKSLANDITGAADVIDDVINKVTGLRGRWVRSNRTTLESNSVSLNDTLANLNEAQSSIRDADFAERIGNLPELRFWSNRYFGSGIANQSSQSVLSLLR